VSLERKQTWRKFCSLGVAPLKVTAQICVFLNAAKTIEQRSLRTTNEEKNPAQKFRYMLDIVGRSGPFLSQILRTLTLLLETKMFLSSKYCSTLFYDNISCKFHSTRTCFTPCTVHFLSWKRMPQKWLKGNSVSHWVRPVLIMPLAHRFAFPDTWKDFT